MAVLVPPVFRLGAAQEDGRRLYGARLAALGDPMSRASYSVVYWFSVKLRREEAAEGGNSALRAGIFKAWGSIVPI